MSLILSGTDGLSDVDGSAATPAIRGTDANTGIFFPAADTIAFAEGGVEAMRIDSSGNVGIGTTSPSGRLHVANTGTAGTTADNLAVYFTSANRNTNVFIRAKNTDGSILNFGDGDSDTAGRLSYEHSDNSLRIDVNSAERMRLDSSGNLGLGVTPSAWGTSNKAIDVASYVSFGYRSATNGTVVSNNSYLTSGDVWTYKNTAAASAYQQIGGVHYWSVAASGTAGTTVTGFNSAAMTLNASGNLGITETSPTAKLHISVASAVVDGTKGVKITNPGGTAVMFECGVSGDSFIGTTSGSDFNIRTGNTVRATFDNAGNLLVGATSTLGSTAGILVANGGANVQAITTNSTSSSAYYIGRFYSGGTEKGYIYFDGTNVSYTNLSDYRLKENVQPMQNALDKVAQLNPVTYNWKSNGKDGQGFIAHELQAVVPDCVTGDKDAVDEDGNPKYQGVDTSFLVATLTAAIKEQQALITTLTARITALESA